MTATEDEKAKALEAMPGDEGDFFFIIPTKKHSLRPSPRPRLLGIWGRV
jgi:hypothetical protein